MRKFNKEDGIFICSMIMILICILFDWLQSDIDNIFQPPPISEALFGMLLIGMFAIAIALAFANIYINIKKNPLKSIVPLLIIIIVAFSRLSVTYTEWYANLNYNLFKNDREKIVKLFNEREAWQVGSNKYMLPARFRLTSKTGCVYTDNDYNYDDYNELCFVIQPGSKRSEIYYIKDSNAMPKESEFVKFVTVKELDEHWYWVLSQ